MYHDRSQFGVLENKNSKIRQIFTKMTDINRAHMHLKYYGTSMPIKHSRNLKNIRDILEAFT